MRRGVRDIRVIREIGGVGEIGKRRVKGIPTVIFVHEMLLIYQKTYDLAFLLYPVINRIPKSHRLVLGRHLEELCLSLLILIIKANKARDKKRQELQEQISDELDCLRILIRLTKDLRFMSIKQYTLVAERINEIGRMLIGWMKA